NEWDILIFTQNWPNSVCLAWQEKSKGATCTLPNDTTKWTIHGIWPTKLGTTGPWFCDPSRPFNLESIYGLLPQLEEVWTPVQNHKKRYMLWRHEWEKHGTCAAQIQPLDSEFKYFEQGLQWAEKYGMVSLLEKAGIKPSSVGYDPQSIWQGVKRVLGKDPCIVCYDDQHDGVSYLQEIRLCFDKNLSLVNCDGVKKSWGYYGNNNNNSLIQCPLNKPTLYLKQVPDRTKISPDPHIITIIKTIQFLQWISL
ncbi:hypothetical protein AAG570_004035, partial [Ranatra chinensis]